VSVQGGARHVFPCATNNIMIINLFVLALYSDI